MKTNAMKTNFMKTNLMKTNLMKTYAVYPRSRNPTRTKTNATKTKSSKTNQTRFDFTRFFKAYENAFGSAHLPGFLIWRIGFTTGDGSWWNLASGLRQGFCMGQKDPKILHWIQAQLGFGYVRLGVAKKNKKAYLGL